MTSKEVPWSYVAAGCLIGFILGFVTLSMLLIIATHLSWH